MNVEHSMQSSKVSVPASPLLARSRILSDEDYVLIKELRAKASSLRSSPALPPPSVLAALSLCPATGSCYSPGVCTGDSRKRSADPDDSRPEPSLTTEPGGDSGPRGCDIPAIDSYLRKFDQSLTTYYDQTRRDYVASLSDNEPGAEEGMIVGSRYYFANFPFTHMALMTGTAQGGATFILNAFGPMSSTVTGTDSPYYRQSNTVRIQGCKIEGVIQRTITGITAGGQNWQPTIYMTLWREKLPISPGAPDFAPYVAGALANTSPLSFNPNSLAGLYTRAGSNGLESSSLAFRSPISTIWTKVYKRHLFDANTGNECMQLHGGDIGHNVLAPRRWRFSFDIPMDFYCHYTNGSTDDPLDNNLFVRFEVDRDPASGNQGNDYYYMFGGHIAYTNCRDIAPMG